MDVQIIDNDSRWNNLVQELGVYSFMQSSGSYYLLLSEAKIAYRMALIGSDHSVLSISLVYVLDSRRGKMLIVPHGPVFRNNIFDRELFEAWSKQYELLARKHHCSCVRIAPSWSAESSAIPIGYNNAPIHIHAEQTIVIHTNQSEEALLADMRKNTRSLVRKAISKEQEGVLVSRLVDTIDDEMYAVYEETTKRGNFVGFKKEHLQAEFDTFAQHEKAYMLCVYDQTHLLSWGMVLIVANKAYYHHGANRIDKINPSSYLFYWRSILHAKSLGCESYDLWGISPKNSSSHPWKSISLFKSGFGGQYIELAHAIDKPISYSYIPLYIFEKIRAFRRGFSYPW
jgi:peptidoglycan pentaglycine glycine transferase (the first glycine)